MFLQREAVSPDGAGGNSEPDSQRPEAQGGDWVLIQVQTGRTSLQGGFRRGQAGHRRGQEAVGRLRRLEAWENLRT